MRQPTTIPLKYLAGINEYALPEMTSPDFRLRYLDIGAVGHGELIAAPQELSFEDAPSRARRLVHPGDTIVSTVRTYLRAVWHVSGDVDGLVVSTGFAVLTPRTVDPLYLAWWVQSDAFIEEVVARSVGVSYPAISPADLGGLPVRVPPQREQVSIANFLTNETTRIAMLIAKKQRMIDLLELRGRQYEGDISLRCGGEEVPLRWYVRVRSGEGLPSEELAETGRTPVVGGNGVMGWTERPSLVNEPSIAVGRVGALCGNVHPLDPPSWVTDNALWIHAIRRFDRDFLAVLLRSSRLNELADRTAQPLLTGEKVKALRLPLPPIADQHRINEELGRFRERNATVMRKLGSQIELLQEHRQALISAAVRGELEIPEAAA